MSFSASIYLTGDGLASALTSGIHRVIDEQDVLNKINVFPVADGNTGTNLCLTLGAVLRVLDRPGEKHLGTLLATVADALLDGASGNSGAIVAQFFQGMSDSAGDLTHFTTHTFSAADIPDDDLERLDIHMVPCRIQFGDRGYLDKVSITSEEFFNELATNPHFPTTSQPAPGDFRRQYQFLASHFPDVLSINLTGMASGTLQAARSAAERVNSAGRIHVINPRNASLGQGLLVTCAAECAKEGLSIDATLTAVRTMIPQTCTYGLLNDLRYAVRGGRVPRYIKTIADLLRLTAILSTQSMVPPPQRTSLSGESDSWKGP